jgi:glycosyltransferase involved in cell wall biosynthesis
MSDSADSTVSVPRFSVVMCNYNHGEYLHRSVSAICSSAIPPELIVVDDGSTDNSKKILLDLKERYPNLQIIFLDRNIGVVEAGRIGLEKTTGDYVAWFAADDKICSTLIDLAQEAVTSHPRMGVVTCAVKIKTNAGAQDFTLYTFGFPETVTYFNPHEFRNKLRQRYLWLPSQGAFMQRDALLAAGGWQVELDFLSDWAAVYAIALRQGVILIDEPLAIIHQRSDSFGNSGLANQMRRDRAFRALLNFLERAENSDFRMACLNCPDLLLVPLGWPIIRIAAASTRTLDIAIRLLLRRIKHSIDFRLKKYFQ